MVLTLLAGAAFAQRIEVKSNDFASTSYLTPDQPAQIRAQGHTNTFEMGMVDYNFTVPQAGWYELYIRSGDWPTDLYMDGEFLLDSPFTSGVWPAKDGAAKTINVDLTAGQHTLRFDHSWPYGLPLLTGFFLDPSTTVAGMVRVAPIKDYLDFRLGERFPVELKAGRLPQAYALTLTMTNVESGEVVHTLTQQVPAGTGTYTATLDIPTDLEGIFDIKTTDAQGNAVDRITQYIVVDTKHRPTPGTQVEKELVATIDCTTQAPDYASSGGTHPVQSPLGSYLEAGPNGFTEDLQKADWFAYTLHLPSKEELYEAEIQYPDDDQRCFLMMLGENDVNPWTLSLGVMCGGEFSLSNKMQTYTYYFYPRQNDPRLIFYNWFRGQRAAVGNIHVYRVTGNLPVLGSGQPGGRQFGLYQEEPLRFTTYWGAEPVGNTWANINRSADRYCQWSNYIGANLWHPTIAVYQAVLWPTKVMPGQAPADTDGYGVQGPATEKEPFRKDTIRLMLLNCEKYGMSFLGEVFLPINDVLARYLDQRMGGTGTIEDNSPAKPWLCVDRTGQIAPNQYNALYPGVQDFVASFIQELATRYSDSPAFLGVDLRLLGWQFSGWQTVPSINWGYEDWTIAQFEKDTGVQVPVPNDDPQRFSKRYDWLMANAYKQWVDWRCQRIHAYHKRLADILTKARPDLKLHLDCYGPTYDDKYGRDFERAYAQKGWLGMIRESGIDPDLYKHDQNIVLNEDHTYPPTRRDFEPLAMAQERARNYNPEPLEAFAKPEGDGTVSYVHFESDSFEGELMPSAWVGLHTTNPPGATGNMLLPAGVMYPAAQHYLARFATALAEANIIYITDGNHGYDQQQPQYLRDWLAQYEALPAIGMTRLAGSGDPVALWSGRQGDQTIFYVVNRAPYAVGVTVRFAAKPNLRRLLPAQAVPMDGDSWALTLEPYQLLALSSNVAPQALTTTVPAEVKSLLDQQIGFTDQILRGEGAAAGVTLIPYSLADQQAAEQQLTQARADYAAGRFCAARMDLLNVRLVKVYEAFAAYPPDLLYRKAPAAPAQALSPQDLLAQSTPPGAQAAAVIPAGQIAPALSGEEVLAWAGSSLDITVNATAPNSYRLSLGYVSQPPYARPTVLIGGLVLPGQQGQAVQENQLWGQITLLPPVALGQGTHQVEIRPQDGKHVGLFYLKVDPIYRDLVASDWMVIGPFPGAPSPTDPAYPTAQMSVVYPPETVRDFTASYPGADGKPVNWIHPTTQDSYVNLHEITGVYNWKISYAVTYIDSPEDRTAELKFGMDYFLYVWLNGAPVFGPEEAHGPPVKAQFTVPVHLKKGRNELLLKLHAGSTGNGFWAGITDPGDLRISPR
jgi:hypothetical protein